jgi:hypothetical protein
VREAEPRSMRRVPVSKNRIFGDGKASQKIVQIIAKHCF